jgi:phytoene dehydrogenase-like protein
VRPLAATLEATALVLLLLESVGERRAARWKQWLQETDELAEDVGGAFLGELGRVLWRFDPKRVLLLLARLLLSAVARFDGWKDRHHLGDPFFVLALILGVSGVASFADLLMAGPNSTLGLPSE